MPIGVAAAGIAVLADSYDIPSWPAPALPPSYCPRRLADYGKRNVQCVQSPSHLAHHDLCTQFFVNVVPGGGFGRYSTAITIANPRSGTCVESGSSHSWSAERHSSVAGAGRAGMLSYHISVQKACEQQLQPWAGNGKKGHELA